MSYPISFCVCIEFHPKAAPSQYESESSTSSAGGGDGVLKSPRLASSSKADLHLRGVISPWYGYMFSIILALLVAGLWIWFYAYWDESATSNPAEVIVSLHREAQLYIQSFALSFLRIPYTVTEINQGKHRRCDLFFCSSFFFC